jgi:RNA recognition motif-containing protein
MKEIYIGNLPYTTTEADLEGLFGEFGEIKKVNVITDRQTGRSKGFAFIGFAEDSQASAAVDKMNGHEMAGRALRVNIAEDRRTGGGSGGNGGHGGRR